MTAAPDPFRSGFVAVVGRPNAGKSTLVNALLGTKISIASPKPQTTRQRIQGIVTRPDAQIVLVDTPGYTEGTQPLLRALRRSAAQAAREADLSVVVIAAAPGRPELAPEDHAALRAARQAGGPVVVALNKMDLLVHRGHLLPWMAAIEAAAAPAVIVPVAARARDNLGALEFEMISRLPEGGPLFPPDLQTTQAEQFACAELVREQLLLQLDKEVPHSAAVIVDDMEDGREAARPLCRIEARIVVERPSQKAILIGRGGHQIRDIGAAARRPIERLLGCQVHLALKVAVDPGWSRTDAGVARYGMGGAPC